jgi:RNA polymerase sigma-70 factor (ECF subfamily)
VNGLTDHLFRREWSRLVAAVTRIFGMRNLALAEDVVQDAFCRAIEVWRFTGVPDNPAAWLMATAKNRALDRLRRERTAQRFGPELSRWIENEATLTPAVEELLGPAAIKDDELRMMFSCCHPALAQEAQIALVLHILCGFSVEEIANALVSGRAAIAKRVTRAKKTLAETEHLFDVTSPSEFAARMPAVQHVLYLLFNEGYHGASPISAVRSELCREAMRLSARLVEHPLGATPSTYALSALMCLNAARLPARLSAAGQLNSFESQNRELWDRNLLGEGLKLLEMSAAGRELSEYHVEAAIAATHARSSGAQDTDWSAIVSLYDTLMGLRPSPIVALNRAIAIAQRDGPERGLEELEKIADRDRLANYPFLPGAQAELELRLGRRTEAKQHFTAALNLARNPMERQFLASRIAACAEPR